MALYFYKNGFMKKIILTTLILLFFIPNVLAYSFSSSDYELINRFESITQKLVDTNMDKFYSVQERVVNIQNNYKPGTRMYEVLDAILENMSQQDINITLFDMIDEVNSIGN